MITGYSVPVPAWPHQRHNIYLGPKHKIYWDYLHIGQQPHRHRLWTLSRRWENSRESLSGQEPMLNTNLVFSNKQDLVLFPLLHPQLWWHNDMVTTLEMITGAQWRVVTSPCWLRIFVTVIATDYCPHCRPVSGMMGLRRCWGGHCQHWLLANTGIGNHCQRVGSLCPSRHSAQVCSSLLCLRPRSPLLTTHDTHHTSRGCVTSGPRVTQHHLDFLHQFCNPQSHSLL